MSLGFHFNPEMYLPRPPQQIPDELIRQFKAAISSNNLNAITALLNSHLASGSNGQFQIHDLYPVMYEALRQDNAAIVEELLRYGMDTRYTFAQAAIIAKAKDCLCVFLQNGWDINKPISETEPTVLAYAVADKEMALWLLDHGADLNKQTYIDLTPMSYAIQLASPSLIEELLNSGGDVHRGELLQHALDRPTTDVIEVMGMLLDWGAPLNATMYENHDASRGLYPFMEFGTPLHKATEMGKVDVVRFLLGRGADVTIRDAKGRTPRESAKRAGYNEDVEILKSVPGG